jgi:hypothetical protein
MKITDLQNTSDLHMDNIVILKPLERSDWQCELFGTGREMVLRPLKGKEPNWFWRAMQFYAFGNRWVKAGVGK